MMRYKNTKVIVQLPDGDTDYFDIIVDVLQADTLALYLFIIGLDFVNLMKENCFMLAEERSRRFSAQILTDADYVDLHTASGKYTLHPPRLDPCYIVWSGQQTALASMWTQTKQNTYALIKEATSPH